MMPAEGAVRLKTFPNQQHNLKILPVPVNSENVGQNVYVLSTVDYVDPAHSQWLNYSVMTWSTQIQNIKLSQMRKYKERALYVAYGVQLVWAKLKYVGCGRSFYGKDYQLDNNLVIICNYAPGISLNEPVIRIGKVCSACPTKKCNVKFDNLCGTIRSPEKDPFNPPQSK